MIRLKAAIYLMTIAVTGGILGCQAARPELVTEPVHAEWLADFIAHIDLAGADDHRDAILYASDTVREDSGTSAPNHNEDLDIRFPDSATSSPNHNDDIDIWFSEYLEAFFEEPPLSVTSTETNNASDPLEPRTLEGFGCDIVSAASLRVEESVAEDRAATALALIRNPWWRTSRTSLEGLENLLREMPKDVDLSSLFQGMLCDTRFARPSKKFYVDNKSWATLVRVFYLLSKEKQTEFKARFKEILIGPAFKLKPDRANPFKHAFRRLFLNCYQNTGNDGRNRQRENPNAGIDCALCLDPIISDSYYGSEQVENTGTCSLFTCNHKMHLQCARQYIATAESDPNLRVCPQRCAPFKVKLK